MIKNNFAPRETCSPVALSSSSKELFWQDEIGQNCRQQSALNQVPELDLHDAGQQTYQRNCQPNSHCNNIWQSSHSHNSPRQANSRQPDSLREDYSTKDSVWLDIGKTLGLSILFAFGIRAFVAEARYIPTRSMVPTLLVNDHLLVDKLSYRFQAPQRGDIAVFSSTDRLKAKGYQQDFIKRVIGVPGDTVTVQAGKVLVHGVPLVEHYVSNNQPTLVEACNSLGIETPFLATAQTIPANHYLVLGDNRLNSADGRCWGLVPRSHFIGRALFRFWPVPRVGPVSAISQVASRQD